MNTDQIVLYAVDGAVARVTLNRPEKRNALNDAVIAGIKDGLKKASKDERVRVVVISGAGKDFCSGADLSALQKIANASVAENAEDARLLLELFLLIRQLPLPVVAAVTGRALAGGRPKVEEIVAYWPALIPKEEITPVVEVLET